MPMAAGAETIDKLGNDPIVRSLLLLYSLHPEDLQTRVRKSIDVLRPRLRKLNYRMELIRLEEGVVRLQVSRQAMLCGSTTENVRSMVEEGVYEYAPDVTSLVILGLEGRHRPASSPWKVWPALASRMYRQPLHSHLPWEAPIDRLSFTARTRTDHAKRSIAGHRAGIRNAASVHAISALFVGTTRTL